MGFFNKLKDGLKKTREDFKERVDKIFVSFGKVDEELFEDLEDALISADVGFDTSALIIDRLRKRVKDDRVTQPDEVRRLLTDIITDIMSEEAQPLKLGTKPSVIFVIGVNGVGKTTSIGKMAAAFKAQGKKVIVAAGDTFRAAAIDQLEVWTERAGVDMIKQKEGADPAAVLYDAIAASRSRNADILILDTAGRLHTKKNLMEELNKLYRVLKRELPNADCEVLLALDATTGQNGVAQAKKFAEGFDIDGIILTKLDGTAKGGIVISIKSELGIPVKLIGVGEKIDDLQEFVPADFVRAMFE